MLFSNKVNTKEESTKDRIEVVNDIGNLHKKTIAIEAKRNVLKNEESNTSKIKNPDINIDNINNSKQNESHNVNNAKNNDSIDKNNITYDIKSVNKTVQKSDINDKNMTSSEKGDVTKDTNTLLKQDVSVFKVSKWRVQDTLTLLDKEKLLSVVMKLSPVDYKKITQYLQNGSNEDIKNTIKLLRERLSDKDYKKIMEVAQKFINIDVVER
jgi:hypothetical protein